MTPDSVCALCTRPYEHAPGCPVGDPSEPLTINAILVTPDDEIMVGDNDDDDDD